MAKAKLKHLNIDEIQVGERFRKDLGQIEELMAAIVDKGLLQPITVSDSMELLAGGRRLEACRRLEYKTIPALIRETEDSLDLREVELMENVHRKDFTWQEEAALTLEIHRLMEAKDPEWSGRKTAELLDKGKSNIANKLDLAKALEAIPELGNYKTADEARKVVKKLEEDVIKEELTKRQRARIDSYAPDKDGIDPEAAVKSMTRLAEISYMIGDVFNGMSKMRTNGKVGFIECDPPYGIDLNNQKGGRDSSVSTVHGYKEVETDVYPAFLKQLTSELYRVADKDAWMIFWYGPTWHQQVLDSLRDAGWAVDDIPAIWVKMSGQTMQPEIHLARGYEPFFVCRKGRPVLAKRGSLNVFNVAATPPQQKYHPTERPVHLIRLLLRIFTLPNHKVFVPFLGSGATLRGCCAEGRQGFGYDLDDKYKDQFLLHIEDDARKFLKYGAANDLDVPSAE